MKVELLNAVDTTRVEELEQLIETAFTLSEENRTECLERAAELCKEQNINRKQLESLINQKRKELEGDKTTKYNADGTGRLTLLNLEKSLQQMKITVKYNIITHKIEYSGTKLNYATLGARNNTAPVDIYDELQHYLKGCTPDKVTMYLNNIAEKHRYNPVLDRISGTNWDGKNRLEELYSLLSVSEADELSRTLIKKWCMQCYCGLHNTLEKPFSLDMVLVFLGGQGYGKTRLLEKLAMYDYFGEGKRINPDNKDSIMQATCKWITELGEIGSTMKSDTDMLKAFISNRSDEYRTPYGRTATEYPRLTSFCGSCNNTEYLVDETGNRRFLTVRIPDGEYIDLKGNLFNNFNSLQFWAQIKTITEQAIKDNGLTYASVFRLTHDEIKQSESRNNAHLKKSDAEEKLQDILFEAQTIEDGYKITEEYYTITELQEEHTILAKFTTSQIRKALKRMGYTPNLKRRGENVDRCYKLPKKQPIRRFSATNSGNPYM